MGSCLSSPAHTRAVKHIGVHASRLAALRNERFTLADVTRALREVGLESSEVRYRCMLMQAFNATHLEWSWTELIVCIDLTKSNQINGKSFGGTSSGSSGILSGYGLQVALSALGRTLADFDDDQNIAAYGFGDTLSRDRALVNLAPGRQQPCNLEAVLKNYSQVLPTLQLSGPTTFAPAINKALDIVRTSGGTYHILVLIADGQVVPGQCMKDTKSAISEAAHYPLSIIMVGVGDGPWECMKQFDDKLYALHLFL